MINAKLIPYLFRIVTLVLVGAGFYYVGSESGYDQAITEISKQSAQVIEQALHEQGVINAEHQAEVAQYEKLQRQELSKVSDLKARLREIEAEKPHVPDGVLCDDIDSYNADIVGVYISAIDTESLHRETNITESATEKDTVAEYLLRCVNSYNSCAVQLNTLIEVVE